MMMVIMLMGFIVVSMFVSAIVWVARDLLVKSPRRRQWVAEHDELVGGEKFYAWCRDQKVDPRYFL